MLDKLKKHHIGIIVSDQQVGFLEKKYKGHFHMDETQGTRVMFVPDDELGMYREYIVKEGRAKNLALGFAHFCYCLSDNNALKCFKKNIKENKLGYPVTKLEKSGSLECGLVQFFFIKNHGLIEINV